MISSWSRHGWKPWHLYGALLLLFTAMAVRWEAWWDIAQIAWNDEEASQVILAPIVAAWLIFIRRRRFRKCRPSATWIGPLVITLGAVLSVWGYREGIQSAWHAGAVLIAMGAVFSVLGKDVVLQFLPAIIVLGFLVPVPQTIRLQVAIPLQTVSAEITQHVLDLAGIPVMRSGNQLTINGQAVTVAEACNGMRMVFALTVVAYAFAFGVPLRGYVRILILAASPILAVFINVLRLGPTVWVYGNYPKATAAIFHDWAGWVMLPVAFGLLLGIISVLKWARIPVAPYTLAYD